MIKTFNRDHHNLLFESFSDCIIVFITVECDLKTNILNRWDGHVGESLFLSNSLDS